MAKKKYSGVEVQKMVKTTMKKSDWNNKQFAESINETQPRLSKFMKSVNPSSVPMKILKALGLKKSEPRYEDE